MSALRFTSVDSRMSNRCCHLENCSRSGARWMFILDRQVGMVCTRHEKELREVWDGALNQADDTEQVAA